MRCSNARARQGIRGEYTSDLPQSGNVQGGLGECVGRLLPVCRRGSGPKDIRPPWPGHRGDQARLSGRQSWADPVGQLLAGSLPRSRRAAARRAASVTRAASSGTESSPSPKPRQVATPHPVSARPLPRPPAWRTPRAAPGRTLPGRLCRRARDCVRQDQVEAVPRQFAPVAGGLPAHVVGRGAVSAHRLLGGQHPVHRGGAPGRPGAAATSASAVAARVDRVTVSPSTSRASRRATRWLATSAGISSVTPCGYRAPYEFAAALSSSAPWAPVQTLGDRPRSTSLRAPSESTWLLWLRVLRRTR